jgi:Baseplate J-like protein
VIAGSIVYLDVDDEITSAAARVRESDAPRVALVLPYGSRVATSRINFRLLSRDALINEKQLAAISTDPATRALAASAGLPVFGSVAEYESSLAGIEADIAPGSENGAIAGAAGATTAPSTVGARPVSASAGAPRADGAPGREPRMPMAPPPSFSPRPPYDGPPGPPSTTVPRRRGSSRSALFVGLAILALIVLVGGVAAYLLLPSATIVIVPRPETLPPVEITVTADTAATEPNPTALVVPAVRVPLDVSVSDTFATTGKKVDETAATGRVRFSNLDFLRTNTVAGGSIVSTNAGVRFRVNSTVTVPRADLVGLTVFPGNITVGVTAVEPGLAGNVEPNTIVIVPRGEDPQALKVVNPDALTGGTHVETPMIEQADIDAALKQLGTDLDTEFQARLGDPSIGPPGATVFRGTATLGASSPTVDPTTLLGQEIDSFELGLAATGSVIAVDPGPISPIAEQRLRATVPIDHELVAGSIEVNVGEATVTGQTVTFPATATARQVATLDPAALRSMVLGRSLADARAILAPYGNVEVTAWPDWVSSIPTIESRVAVSIEGAVPVETPAPSGPAS